MGDPDFKTEQPWVRCKDLVDKHRTGKHLVVLANMADRLVKHLTTLAPPLVK